MGVRSTLWGIGGVASLGKGLTFALHLRLKNDLMIIANFVIMRA